jgi:hypothetical protein
MMLKCVLLFADSVISILRRSQVMFDRSIRLVGIAVFLICLLGPGTAFATLKCQCNNGTISHAMGASFDDDDVEESCNDACSESGGGRVWQLDQDRENVVDNSGRGNGRRNNQGPRN